jgi:iron complex outermembrane receptor protein
MGLRVQRDALSLDAALYRARVDGELLALTDGNGNPLGTVNADRTIHQGLELGLGWHFAQQWLLSTNYLWNDFRFDHDPVYGDNELAGIPSQQLRTSLRWSRNDALYIAPDYYVDHSNTFRAPGYTLLGLRMGGRLASRWSWFVDARNLTDRKWIASTNVVADARGQDQANFMPGDGRSVYAGLEWAMQ